MFDEKLLEFLVCPETKQKLRLATEEELSELNSKIRAGSCSTKNGESLSTELDALLLREDGNIGFQVCGSIPVMLIEEAIELN